MDAIHGTRGRMHLDGEKIVFDVLRIIQNQSNVGLRMDNVQELEETEIYDRNDCGKCMHACM